MKHRNKIYYICKFITHLSLTRLKNVNKHKLTQQLYVNICIFVGHKNSTAVKIFALHITAIIAFLFANIAELQAVSNKDNRILIISSYNPETATNAEVIDEFTNYYDKHGDGYAIVIESMNCKSLSEASTWTTRIRNIIKRYSPADVRPAMIILLGQEAWASYLSLKPSEIMANTPVMCCMVSRNIVRMPSDTCNIETWMPHSIDYTFLKSRYNVVGGILYEYDIEKNIDLVRKLYPDTKNIALLTDNSYGGLTLLAYLNDYMLKHKEYNFIKLDGRSKTIYSMSETIDKLPDKTVMLLGTWRVDKTESFYVKNSSRILMEANRNLPVISLSSLGMKFWSVGGYMPVYNPQGEDIARKVIEYFDNQNNGKTTPDLITFDDNHYLFNRNLLEPLLQNTDFHIPAGADFVNNDNTFYETNKLIINCAIAAFIALLSILGLIFWFLAKTRRLNAQLRSYQKELLIQKEKAEDNNRKKTAFLANMSHEIRTPLNAIVGFTDVLTNDPSLSDAERKQINDIISQNSQMLLALINEILDMARLESGKVKYAISTCDVVNLCRDILTTCKAAANRNDIVYKFDCELNECTADIDKQHIKEVLINLLTNANKFTEYGEITLTFRRLENMLYFAVSDTGIGIPLEKREKVFERFEKVNEESNGSGIGLALCKSIVEHFKGRIWIDPQYNEGARICFTIPYTSPDNKVAIK